MTVLIAYIKSIFGFGSYKKVSKGANFLEYPASYRVKILRAAAREAKKTQAALLARYDARIGKN